MRNFWIEATIDGKKTKLASGPRAKDGGFELTVRMRDKGTSVVGATVTGWVMHDGRLALECGMDKGEDLRKNTSR